MNQRRVIRGGRFEEFLSKKDASFVLPDPDDGPVLAFCESDAKRPEYKGEYVERVGSMPSGGPLRFQSRRRDLLWHFVKTGRVECRLRTGDSLAVVMFPADAGYSALTHRGSFETHRMHPMASRQLALERKRTGDRELTSLGVAEHFLEAWPDPRIKVALAYGRLCRVKRSASTDRNARDFLAGGPCKGLIYFMAFRQLDDPISKVLVYVGQTKYTMAVRMEQHFEAHATLADMLCMTTAANDVVAFVLDIAEPGESLDMLEAEAIAAFACVSMHGANMLHGSWKK